MFLIQVDEIGIPMFDFQYELIDMLKQQAWLDNNAAPDFRLVHTQEEGFAIIESDNEGIDTAKRKYVPVGSIEFINGFLDRYFHSRVMAFNVPESVYTKETYTRRLYYKNLTPEEVVHNIKEFKLMSFFVKDARYPKGKMEVCRFMEPNTYKWLLKENPEERYDMSELLDGDKRIVAEYRAFVSGNVIFDVRKYLGDWYTNKKIDNDMLIRLAQELDFDKTIPRDKTIDIALLKNGQTSLLEVHSFISCGTYGYSGSPLPRMMKRAYLWQADNPPKWIAKNK